MQGRIKTVAIMLRYHDLVYQRSSADPERTYRLRFTMTQLLALITALAIMLAILLPWVQVSREAARRMQCSNNNKVLALACLNYESAFKTFPYGAGGTSTNIDGSPLSSNRDRRSGFIAMRSYTETVGYSNYQAGTSYVWPPGGPAGWASFPEWNQSPSWMRCPSDPSGLNVGPFNSYVMSMGDTIGGNAANPDDQIWEFNNLKNVRGIFGTSANVRIREVTDGTSNTHHAIVQLAGKRHPFCSPMCMCNREVATL